MQLFDPFGIGDNRHNVLDDEIGRGDYACRKPQDRRQNAAQQALLFLLDHDDGDALRLRIFGKLVHLARVVAHHKRQTAEQQSEDHFHPYVHIHTEKSDTERIHRRRDNGLDHELFVFRLERVDFFHKDLLLQYLPLGKHLSIVYHQRHIMSRIWNNDR